MAFSYVAVSPERVGLVLRPTMAWCQPPYDASVSMIRVIIGLDNGLVPTAV